MTPPALRQRTGTATVSAHLYRVEINNTGWLHVIAVNTLQAKSYFIRYLNADWGDDLTWADAPDISIRCLKRNVIAPTGVDDWFKWSVENGWMSANWFGGRK